jgi:hypothetical protein
MFMALPAPYQASFPAMTLGTVASKIAMYNRTDIFRTRNKSSLRRCR